MSQTIPVMLNLFAAVLGAFGQYLYKLGAGNLGKVPLYLNWQIGIGMILFTVVMVMFIVSFKLGGRLSVVYPMYATTFIWGAFIGVYFEKESWNMGQTAGIIFILLGLSCLAYFSDKTIT